MAVKKQEVFRVTLMVTVDRDARLLAYGSDDPRDQIISEVRDDALAVVQDYFSKQGAGASARLFT
jgi:hypothetical protein